MTTDKNWTLMCGCKVKVYAPGDSVEVIHCPMHQAAPQLLEALRKLVGINWKRPDQWGCLEDAIILARAAIKAAGG